MTQHFVRKTEGDYENDNFRVMITAVDKYLTGKNRNAKLFLREVLKVSSWGKSSTILATRK